MYESFFGLSGKPFSLLPDADFMYPSQRHRRAMTLLDYGIMTQAGFIVISGEVGSGKTTLIRRYLKSAGADVALGVITNSNASLGGLIQWVSSAFSLEFDQNDIGMYNRFIDFLVEQYTKGRRTVLIVDEAQNLTAPMLEELRVLSNVNNDTDQVLQMILVGQPELLETLKKPELRQFVQRIAIHCHLDPLPPAETAAYIRHRLGVVKGAADIFDDLACAAVHHFSGGVPRLINLLCDQALVYAFSDEQKHVNFQTVVAVAMDRARFGLSAFNRIPETWGMNGQPSELRALVSEIEKGVGA